jgi:hypothetical protein
MKETEKGDSIPILEPALALSALLFPPAKAGVLLQDSQP